MPSRSGDRLTFPPPLPEIKSERIRLQVFTHRSYYGRPNHIFEDHPDDLSPDNEKLEHLGDTVLSLVVTTLMNEMYPGLRVGPSTKIRALVVGNATLAEISARYKLSDHLRLHPAQAITLKVSANVQADVFESFVGGLFLDQGLEAVKEWLHVLLRPYLAQAYRVVRTQHGLPPDSPVMPSIPKERSVSQIESDLPGRIPYGRYAQLNPNMTMTTIGHLALFNQHIQKTNRSVEWIYNPRDPDFQLLQTSTDVSMTGPEDAELISQDVLKGLKTTPVWFVKVLVDGECFGQGKGGTKKVARNEAAKLGLEKLGIHV